MERAALLVVLLLSTGVALFLSAPRAGMVLVALGLLALPVVVVVVWLLWRRDRQRSQPQ